MHRAHSEMIFNCKIINASISQKKKRYHHGGRAVLGSKESFPDNLPCNLCGEPDSQFHMICGCTYPPLQQERDNILHTLTQRMNKMDPHSSTYRCLDVIRDLAQPDSPIGSPHYIWIGTWSPTHVAYLQNKLFDVTFNPRASEDPTLKALRTICTSLAAGAREMIRLRMHHQQLLKRARRRLYRRARTSHRSTIIYSTSSSVTSPMPTPQLSLSQYNSFMA